MLSYPILILKGIVKLTPFLNSFKLLLTSKSCVIFQIYISQLTIGNILPPQFFIALKFSDLNIFG